MSMLEVMEDLNWEVVSKIPSNRSSVFSELMIVVEIKPEKFLFGIQALKIKSDHPTVVLPY